jgi:pimeloyl-ACP methyl ester carboxylesterase
MAKVPNILFVHGAWANASSWDKVLPLIDAAGLSGTAVSLSLTSLADDVATVKRAIELIDGPVLLVGHSYGGSVITEAGADPKVSGLVYVAAFAPDAGESAASLGARGPPTRILEQIRPDAHGFFKLTREGVDDVFAQDLTQAERALTLRNTESVCRCGLRWRDHRAGLEGEAEILSARDRGSDDPLGPAADHGDPHECQDGHRRCFEPPADAVSSACRRRPDHRGCGVTAMRRVVKADRLRHLAAGRIRRPRRPARFGGSPVGAARRRG